MVKIFDSTIEAGVEKQVIKIPGHGGEGANGGPKEIYTLPFLLIIIPILKETKTTFIQL
jgi:hypothetical protein